MDPFDALSRIAYLLEEMHEPTYRVQAFRKAATTIAGKDRDELDALAAAGRLRDLPNVGEKTERVIAEALAGDVPSYLAKLEEETGSRVPDLDGRAAELRAMLRGDCH